MLHDAGSRRKKKVTCMSVVAISADDFTEQEAPVVAIVALPTAKNADDLKSNGNDRLISLAECAY